MTNANDLPNLTILEYSRLDGIVAAMKAAGLSSAHFNNGIFWLKPEIAVPTGLGGFQYAIDQDDQANTPLILALNSDRSMEATKQQKIAAGTFKAGDPVFAENQRARIEKIAGPVALQHARDGRPVFAVLYDEATPQELYDAFANAGFGMRSLHKHGYAAGANAPIIIGAEHFDDVYAYPLANEIKPGAFDITPLAGQRGAVKIVDLFSTVGPHGKPYLTKTTPATCLFQMNDPELSIFAPQPVVDSGDHTGAKPAPRG
jgi:hypothetical protein